MTLADHHKDQWHAFDAAMQGERMHHGWILAGKQGLGKAGFALGAARAYVGSEDSGPASNHPDIHLLTHLPKDAKEEKKRDEGKPFETKRNIAIDQIRGMQSRLTTRPTLGERRAIILNPADDLEKNASNALLKSLEEPPVGTLFLLVTHRPGRLLPTIRSRCRVLRFDPLSAAEVESVLDQRTELADPASREAAIRASGGSPGAAQMFLDLDFGHLHQAMTRLANDRGGQQQAQAELISAYGPRPTREKQLASIELARTVLAQRMRGCDLADVPALADALEGLTTISAQAPTYNFDAGLLILEIGGLLAKAAPASEQANA